MPAQITRVTLIKIPSEEHQVVAMKGFETFAKNQQKDGKPYILSMQIGRAYGSARDQGYTIVARNVFKNKEDMEFYEKECEGHQAYKTFLKENAPVEGLMAVWFETEFQRELPK